MPAQDSLSHPEWLVSLVVDAASVAHPPRVERLEVEMSLFSDTTVSSVISELVAALGQMEMTLLCDESEAALVWYKGGARAELPQFDADASVSDVMASYRRLFYSRVLSEVSTLAFVARDAGETILLSVPQIRSHFKKGTGYSKPYLALMPAVVGSEDSKSNGDHTMRGRSLSSSSSSSFAAPSTTPRGALVASDGSHSAAAAESSEAEELEKQTAALEAVITERTAACAAASQALHEEMAALEATAARLRPSVAREADLRGQLRRAKVSLERARAEEGLLIDELQRQSHRDRTAAAAASSPGPRAQSTAATPRVEAPEWESSSASSSSSGRDMDRLGGGQLPAASTISRVGRRYDSEAHSGLFRPRDSTPPSAAYCPYKDSEATRLSFDDNGVSGNAPEQHSYFFSPALRAQVEDSIAGRDSGTSYPRKTRQESGARSPTIRVMSIRDSEWAAGPDGPADPAARSHDGVSVSDRLRMVTADVGRHLNCHEAPVGGAAHRTELLARVHDIRNAIQEERDYQ